MGGFGRGERRERVVKHVDIGPAVHCARDADPLLLAGGQHGALPANFSHVAGGERVEVSLQGAHTQHVSVPSAVHGASKQDVVTN